MIKILHTGDVHLDSPFASASASVSEVRRNELRATFTSMMTYARMNGIDLILIAGDLFDNNFVSRETVALLMREFAAAPCPIVISPGNHDARTPGSVWDKTKFPDNVFVFANETVSRFSFPELNTDVYGYAFTSKYLDHFPPAGAVPADSDRINILLAHGDMAGSSRYAPVTKDDIAAFGADYTALGHIHNGEKYSDDSLAYAYCGCPEGRDYGECGPKGAVVAEVDKGSVRIRRVRFSKRVYADETLDVSGSSTMTEISDKLREFVASGHFGSEHILRVTLTGKVDPALVVSPASLGDVSGRVFSLEIKDATSPTLDEDSILSDPGVRGECYRLLRDMIDGSDGRDKEVADNALRYAMAALSGENI